MQLNEKDARKLGVAEGDEVEVSSARGTARGAARVGGIARGHVFMPFHYGYWDGEGDHERAANELTITAWGPVSKQPYFKFAAVQVRKAGARSMAGTIADVASKVADGARELVDKVVSSAHKERAHVADYLGLLRAAHEAFAGACRTVAARHLEEPELQQGLGKLAGLSESAAEALQPFVDHYGEEKAEGPRELRGALFLVGRSGAFGALRDLQDLTVLASEAQVTRSVVSQAAKALRDEELVARCAELEEQGTRQREWLLGQVKHRAAHTVVVPG